MPEGRKCIFCSFEKIEVKGFGQSELFFGTTYSIEIWNVKNLGDSLYFITAYIIMKTKSLKWLYDFMELTDWY